MELRLTSCDGLFRAFHIRQGHFVSKSHSSTIMSSPPQPPSKPKPKPRQKTTWAPESDTAVEEAGEVDEEVAALECKMEQERLHAEAHMHQLAELKAKKGSEAVERAEWERKA
jgi:hypothetical protein